MKVVEKRDVVITTKAVEKKDVVITMNNAEYVMFKNVCGMLMKIYYQMSDGDIEKRAKASADFMNEMLWKIKIEEEEA